MPVSIAMLLSNPFRPDPRVLKEAESLTALGYKVTIVCWDRAAEMKPEETLTSSVRILRVQNILSTYGTGARQLWRLLRFWLAVLPILSRLRPDLVHCHDFDTLPIGLLWGKLRLCPVVYDAHEHYADSSKPRLKGIGGRLLYHLISTVERISARMVTAVVTVDETLGAIYQQANSRVVIIGHYPNRVMAAQATAVFTHRDLTLIYVGRLSVDRGLLIYADLLRHLRRQGIPARLQLVGAFTSADEEQRLRKRCEGLEKALDVVGWIHYRQVPALLRQADVGLAILQQEPYYVVATPVKLFEYMATGLPIVASNFPAMAAVMNDAQCGVLVKPTDVEAAASHIRYWWKHPDEARSAGENGRQSVLQKYNWEILMQRLDALYAQITNSAFRE